MLCVSSFSLSHPPSLYMRERFLKQCFKIYVSKIVWSTQCVRASNTCTHIELLKFKTKWDWFVFHNFGHVCKDVSLAIGLVCVCWELVFVCMSKSYLAYSILFEFYRKHLSSVLLPKALPKQWIQLNCNLYFLVYTSISDMQFAFTSCWFSHWIIESFDIQYGHNMLW